MLPLTTQTSATARIGQRSHHSCIVAAHATVTCCCFSNAYVAAGVAAAICARAFGLMVVLLL